MPILQKLIVAYKLWHGYWVHFPKMVRFGLGSRIDNVFLETIENLCLASNKNKDKIIYLEKASDRFDLLKFLLQIAWHLRALEDKKYIALSRELISVGRMLGGWKKKTAAVSR